jgi:hypothetical protein
MKINLKVVEDDDSLDNLQQDRRLFRKHKIRK